MPRPVSPLVKKIVQPTGKEADAAGSVAVNRPVAPEPNWIVDQQLPELIVGAEVTVVAVGLPPLGAAHVASARRKLVVPPPEAGAAPDRPLVKALTKVVCCVVVRAIGVPPAIEPRTVLAPRVGSWARVACPEILVKLG